MGWTAPRDWTGGEVVTEAMMDTHVKDNLTFLKSNTAWATALELTIAAGVITKSQSHHTVDTEADAATDDLDTINGCTEGEVFLLRPAHTDRTVVLKHGTGNIQLPGGQDYSMTTTEMAALCFYNGTKVLVIGIVGLSPHASTHQDAGGDEISVVGLSGELADRQKSKVGDSGLGWTLNKLLKGAGAGVASTEIESPSGAIVGTSDTQELSAKTLNNPKIKDVDATPVGDVLLKVIDEVPQFRNSADTTDKPLALGSIPDLPASKTTTGTFPTARIGDAAITPPKMKTKTAVGLVDADAVLTAAQMIDSGIFTITPTVARVLTTDTAANLVSAMTDYQVGTWFDIVIVCLAAFNVTLIGGTGVTISGKAVVNDASGTWRARFDSASAVTLYRM